MKFLKSLRKGTVDIRKATVLALCALLGFAGLATAQTVYYGWNPVTGLEAFHGTEVSGGALPVLSTTTTACGTTATVAASMAGGASQFKLVANAATCVLKFVFPSAAPNGWSCTATDQTTSTGAFRQTANDTTSCTLTAGGATTAADVVLVNVVGF